MNVPGKLHHLGVAVQDLTIGLGRLEAAYQVERCSAVFEDPGQKVAVQFCELAGGMQVELVAPRGDDSPVNGVLQRGGGLYHTAHSVDDLDAVCHWVREHRGLPLADAAPAFAFGGCRMMFVQFAGLWLVEFVERHQVESVYEED